MTKFSISNAKLIHRGTLLGSFDLEMPSGLIVRGAMLFEKGGRKWVNFPSKEWTKADGSKGYFPLLEFSSREVSDRFQKQVLPLVEEAFPRVPEPAPATKAPHPASREERARGHWSGPADGPSDDMPF